MKRLVSLFLLFFAMLMFANAQISWVEGYIITNDGQKQVGKIKHTTPAQRSVTVHFQEAGEDEKIKYKPFQVKGFYMENRHYESKIYDFDPSLPYGYGVFMERINTGTVKVYYYWNTDKERGFTQTFIENDGDYLLEVDPMRFKKQMAQYFEEYPQLQSKIRQGDYRKKELMDIVKEFNIWKENNW